MGSFFYEPIGACISKLRSGDAHYMDEVLRIIQSWAFVVLRTRLLDAFGVWHLEGAAFHFLTQVRIAFKGFHEAVDSFSAFRYPDTPNSWAGTLRIRGATAHAF